MLYQVNKFYSYNWLYNYIIFMFMQKSKNYHNLIIIEKLAIFKKYKFWKVKINNRASRINFFTYKDRIAFI